MFACLCVCQLAHLCTYLSVYRTVWLSVSSCIIQFVPPSICTLICLSFHLSNPSFVRPISPFIYIFTCGPPKNLTKVFKIIYLSVKKNSTALMNNLLNLNVSKIFAYTNCVDFNLIWYKVFNLSAASLYFPQLQWI